MKHIEVVAAIIHGHDGHIFATQRGYGDFKGYWEFPGGKMEPGESPEEALQREIWEELESRIAVENLLQTVEWDYPQFHLTMHCYLCHVESGHLLLKEHQAAKWLAPDELESIEWLPADWELVRQLARTADTWPKQKMQTTELLRTSQSWDGAALPDYPIGRPELVAMKYVFPVGEKLGWHHHTVMNLGVVAEGELTIVCQDGREHLVHEGEAVSEMVGTIHHGENRGTKPVVLYMFYLSQESAPLSVQHPEIPLG